MPFRLVLITGGAGFLGLHLVNRLRQGGRRVRLFDVVECPDWARGPGIEYVRGDVRDEADVKAALEGVDSFIHAAFATPRQSHDVIRSVNTEGTRIVYRAACA